VGKTPLLRGEAYRERDDVLASLRAHHPPRGKGKAVAQPVDPPVDRRAPAGTTQELRVQGVGVAGHLRPARGDDAGREEEPAEHTSLAPARLDAKPIVAERLQVESPQQPCERIPGDSGRVLPIVPHGGRARHAASPPTIDAATQGVKGADGLPSRRGVGYRTPMPLDPQARELLDQIAALGGRQLHELSVAEARQAIELLSQMTGGTPEAVASVEERRIAVSDTTLTVRVYRPEPATTLPLLVYFHGGGWVIGSLDSHDGLCRALANAGRCVVVAVDYRLAPEHKFPCAVEDAYAATRWAASHAADLGADPRRVAVGGDSAGGNLSAVVTQLARDRGGPELRFAVLIYPATDATMASPSIRDNGEGYLLTAEDMRWFYGHYLRTPEDALDPLASPLHAARFDGLPPAVVVTAELDPLRDEGEAYAARLQAAGAAVTLRRYPGMIHGFVPMLGVLGQAKDAVDEIGQALRTALA